MAGKYLPITQFVAPESAVAGKVVGVSITLKNVWTARIQGWCGCLLSGILTDTYFMSQGFQLEPGATHSLYGQFIMPDIDAPIVAQTAFLGSGGVYYLDDSQTKVVRVVLQPLAHVEKFEIPSFADAGAEVSVKVTVKNIGKAAGLIFCTGSYDSDYMTVLQDYRSIEPQASAIFSLSFTMPPRDIVAEVRVGYLGEGQWITQETVSMKVTAERVPEVAIEIVSVGTSVVR